jgi:anti-sigma B factor antagonist
MNVSCESIKSGVVLKIQGDLDASSSLDFDAQLKDYIAEGHTRIVFDGTQLDYIASAGLGVFISNKDEVYSRGGEFIFFGLSESVFNVFKLLGLTDLFTFVPTREEALARIP